MSTEIASAYVAVYAQMPGVQRDIANALGSADSGVASAGAETGNRFSAGLAGAVGGAMAAVTSSAIGAIAGSIDSAISRVDTINNYPRIMQNLGYSSEEAADSVATMSDRLTGLPTSLDTLAGVTQQLAPLTGGLDEATDLSLALNNALLAGGKDTQLQANAMDQYTQMLSTGSVDMQAWRSIVSAMPGQMDQLAQSLLGAESGQMDLYSAMQDGTVSFDDFNSAILDLDRNGTGAFASFEDQARASTDGIATSQANLQTAITRGMAGLIDRFGPQIAATMAAAGAAVTVAFNAIGVAIDWLTANLDIVIPVLSGVAVALLVVLAPAIWAAVTAAWAFTAALLANPMTWIVLAIVALVAAIVWMAMNWDTVVAWVSDVWGGFIGWITDGINAFVGWWGGIWDTVTSVWQSVWSGIGSFLRDTWNNILGWIEGGVNGAIDLINGLMGGLRDVAGFIGIEVGAIGHVSIPRMADGGVVRARPGGILANIGEGRYDEAVVPLSPDVLSQLGGSGATVNVYPSQPMDAYLVGRIAGDEVARAVRGV